jgi:hypothetical protein
MMIVEAPWPQPTSATVASELELLLDAVERRDPLVHEVPPIAGAEEPLDTAEQPVVVLVPSEPASRPEGLADVVLVGEQRRDQLVRAEDVERAVLVRQREGLLVFERVRVGRGVVAHVSRGGLVTQPLAHIALGGAGAAGDLVRGEGAGVGHCPVQPQLVADQRERRADRGAQVRDGLAHEGLQLGRVDRGGAQCDLLRSLVACGRERPNGACGGRHRDVIRA